MTTTFAPGLPSPLGPAAIATVIRPAGRAGLRRFLRQRTAAAALVVIVALVAAALVVPLFMGDPADVSADILASPSPHHLLGTDDIGRDLLLRTLVGMRFSLFVSLIAVALSAGVGSVIGLVSGYAGGRLDSVLMRIIDGVLAFPGLLVAMGVVGILGPGVQNAMLGLSIVFMPAFARLVRGQVLAVKEELYIEAAVVAGAGPVRITRRHIVPNILAPIVVQTLITMGLAILAEGALSYVGLSVQPPAASLGSLLQEGFTAINDTIRLILVPGVVITVASWCFNAIADGLRETVTATDSGPR